MQIINFNISESDVNNGLAELADNIKLLVYQEDESLIDKIGFNNDKAFLEPSLFYYLRKRAFNELPKINISQIISGYCLENTEKLDVYIDENGVCYLPNLGYTIFDNTVKLITTKNDIQGSVNIVTDDLRLIERIFYQIRKIFL